MESRGKKRLSNIVMLLLILIIFAGGVISIGIVKKQNWLSEEKIHITDSERQEISHVREKEDFSGYDGNICTITILCDAILSKFDILQKGKEAYVPENGYVLETTQVKFEEGETVFEVLKRVCEQNDIQLEYSWTPVYDNYYIEGINHLYEFDCGNESGWMYKVNGWFPNYGCSSYPIENGDDIVWCYTCSGRGEDVGGKVY